MKKNEIVLNLGREREREKKKYQNIQNCTHTQNLNSTNIIVDFINRVCLFGKLYLIFFLFLVCVCVDPITRQKIDWGTELINQNRKWNNPTHLISNIMNFKHTHTLKHNRNKTKTRFQTHNQTYKQRKKILIHFLVLNE